MALEDDLDPAALRVRRESTAEQVAAALREPIVSGRLRGGTRLREGPVAEQLGVSRTTAREALQILISQGLVRREIHRGAYVAEFDADDVRDLFRVRRLVEATAVRELAGSAGDVTEIRAEVDAIAAAAGEGADAATVLAADLHFHQTLVEQMQSDRLGALYTATNAELGVCLALSAEAPVNSDRLVGDLRALVSAIEGGDAPRAAALLELHLDAGEQRLLRRFAAQPVTGV